MENKSYHEISNPEHYCEGKSIEPIQVIQDWDLSFCLGNVIKYVARCGRKDNEIKELRKAIQYLEFEINQREVEDNDR